MNIITGEKLQNLCDYYIGTLNDFRHNPLTEKQIEKQVLFEENEKLKYLKINRLFCKADNLYHNFNLLFDSLKKINTNFDLYFHNSDYAFLEKHKKLFEIENLNKIYCQNISFIPDNKVFPLPIGIANSMWKHGDLNIWNKILTESNLDEKKNNIYFNFDLTTNFLKRKRCFDVIKSKGIQFLPNLDYYNYLKVLSSYKYCICPEGNGLDTHRLWECLYLKVIPITLKNYITNYYSDLFPIVLLNNWEDLNYLTIESNKIKNWDNYKLLDINEFTEKFL